MQGQAEQQQPGLLAIRILDLVKINKLFFLYLALIFCMYLALYKYDWNTLDGVKN